MIDFQIDKADVTVCCVSDARPDWLAFLWKQFRNMDGRNLVLVSAMDNYEKHIAFFKALVDMGLHIEATFLFPEETIVWNRSIYSEEDPLRVLVDFTMPPIRSKTTTIGAKRNRAVALSLEHMRTKWITWMDDDDLCHEDRLKVPLEVVLQAQGQIDFVLMDESCPLLHTELLRAQPEERRAYNWASGLFRAVVHPAFPPLNLSEDYFMMQYVLNVQQFHPERVCQASFPMPLTVHLAHGANSSIADLSTSLQYWPIEPPEEWIYGGKGWTGIGLAPRSARNQTSP